MVGVDLFVLDWYSFLVIGYEQTTSTLVISVFKSWFSRHGIPVTVISDKDPRNSKDFKVFSAEWDFDHVMSCLVLITHKVMAVQKMPLKYANRC